MIPVVFMVLFLEKRVCHGKLRNGHGIVMEKYFVKCVGTLKFVISNLESSFHIKQ